MNTLKTKIIYYYILITFVLLVCEGYLAYFLMNYISTISQAIGIDEMFIELVGAFAGILILFVISYYFYSKVSKSINEESERQIKQRNIIFANISHDLKNPMSSVLGFARALEEGKVKEEEQQAIYRAISDKSTQMNDMILKMFHYAKMESDGYSLALKSEDLGAILRSVIADRYSEIEKHNIQLEIDIPETPVTVNVDITEFSRVINNLITNAIKHNNMGIGVLVSLKGDDDKLSVIVADTGVEIPNSSYQSIFEPFQCSDESRQSKDGSGLGLAISKRIVELHKGKLYIDNHIKGYTKAFVIDMNK
ncbi:MAG: HAMP domain-containing sensor histidine kinase [Acutalibacteraceae bacterium]|nr:HAMP domain-containing sensor histidine kinase [Acutalibacteraceae bacterium]